jgi:hypothetical protein
LKNADEPEPNGDEPNADNDLRFEIAPKPADGVAVLLLLTGEEVCVVNETDVKFVGVPFLGL